MFFFEGKDGTFPMVTDVARSITNNFQSTFKGTIT